MTVSIKSSVIKDYFGCATTKSFSTEWKFKTWGGTICIRLYLDLQWARWVVSVLFTFYELWRWSCKLSGKIWKMYQTAMSWFCEERLFKSCIRDSYNTFSQDARASFIGHIFHHDLIVTFKTMMGNIDRGHFKRTFLLIIFVDIVL